jgi:hypothetical protein
MASNRKVYYANECLLPPPHDTIKKGIMKKVENYSSDNPYHESKDDWCVDCEDAYQFTCMKDYQNLYEHLYPDEELDYKENFYYDYDKMLDSIDDEIKNNPDMTKEEIIKSMTKGYAVENFLDTCIQMRLNQHKHCVRRDDDLYKQIGSILPKYLEGDKGHKKHIKVLTDLKKKGTDIINNALTHPKGTGLTVKVSKKHKNSRANNKKDSKSRRTRSLIRRKKSNKKKRS